MRLKKLISSVANLKPLMVLDPKTGEIITDWEEKVTQLIRLVQNTAEQTWDDNRQALLPLLEEGTRYKPAEQARQWGYKLTLPMNLLARSRVERLYQHKLISEAEAWVRNKSKNKGPLQYSPKINLGAVDKQMCSLSVDTNEKEITLLWKCWDKEMLFVFGLPSYLLSRNVKKYCLPVVRINKQGVLFFDFSIEETPKTRSSRPAQKAGLDLGRVVPYTMVVLNQNNKRVAHYTSSPRLSKLNAKRERLLNNRKSILNKIKAYEELGIFQDKKDTLLKEAGLIRGKIQRLGITVSRELAHEVTQRLIKHDLNTLALEDLTWVTGAKYGGRWNHSAQQAQITHSLSREGIRTRKVNPKNTSQTCSKCSAPITHNTKSRTVWCVECKHRLDRDYNAAINITKKLKTYPASRRETGDNASEPKNSHVIGTPHKSVSQESLLLTRMIT